MGFFGGGKKGGREGGGLFLGMPPGTLGNGCPRTQTDRACLAGDEPSLFLKRWACG